MTSDIDKAFKENVTFKDKFTHWEAACNKGLWSATAITKAVVEKEAKHYFIQYYEDGEYD